MTPIAVVVAGAVAAALTAGPVAVKLAHRVTRQPIDFPGVAAVAATAGIGFVALSAQGPAITLVGLPLLVLGLAAAIVDVQERRLPDRLTGPLMACTVAALLGITAATGDLPVATRSVTAAVVLTGAMLAIKAVHSAAVGWGDVKLMPSLGAVLGWTSWDALLTTALLWVLLIGITALAVSADDRRAVVPYGPALLAGALGSLATAT